ncbi:MAG: hypothetical protein HPY66_2459 [Firmicutes bacterium]|nr:hypothetical protein [Bacillota bacterium]
MNVLVYGAGVLGSYLAHELCKGNHSVAMLARGRRYDDLLEHGLIIQHFKQKNRTVDHIRVVDCLKPDDGYDIIFAVVQKSQLRDVLPVLAQNTATGMIALIGNNCESEKTFASFMETSLSKPLLLFGFLSCAGHRDGEVVYNWHKDNCTLTIGSFEKQNSYIQVLEKLLSGTSLRLSCKPDINAWLKNHCALITPLCLALQYERGAPRSLRSSAALRLAIEAVKQSVQMFKSQGFYDELQNTRLLRWPTKRLQWILARFLPTKTGHLMAVDHALSAVNEIDTLTRELLSYSESYNYPLPALKELYEIVKELRK